MDMASEKSGDQSQSKKQELIDIVPPHPELADLRILDLSNRVR